MKSSVGANRGTTDTRRRQSFEDGHERLRTLFAEAGRLERAEQLLNELGGKHRDLQLTCRFADEPQILLLETNLEGGSKIAIEDLPPEVLKCPAVACTAGERLVQFVKIETRLGAEHQRFAGREEIDGSQDLI